jgi:hypothetical protein
VGKRGNCTIVEKARNMIFSSGIPSFLWFKTMNTLNYLVNIGPTHANKSITPKSKTKIKKRKRKKKEASILLVAKGFFMDDI